MRCGRLFPTEKWKSLDKIEQLKSCIEKGRHSIVSFEVQKDSHVPNLSKLITNKFENKVEVTLKNNDNLNIFEEALKTIDKNIQQCYICNLVIKTYDLYNWREKNGFNVGLKNMIEVFMAVLCFKILHSTTPEDIKQNDIEELASHLDFIETFWYKRYQSYAKHNPDENPYLANILENCFTKNSFWKNYLENYQLSNEIQEMCKNYLETYLSVRSLGGLISYNFEDMKSNKILKHYDALFDEYFNERLSLNVVNMFGRFCSTSNNRHVFITAHTRETVDSCVSFVCMKDTQEKSEKIIRIQGIVTCPFFRCYSKGMQQEPEIGGAHSLMHYLNNYRGDRKVRVDPIDNKKWQQRLKNFGFLVNYYGNEFNIVDASNESGSSKVDASKEGESSTIDTSKDGESSKIDTSKDGDPSKTINKKQKFSKIL